EVINSRDVVAGFPNGYGSIQVQPRHQFIAGANAIFLGLPRADAGERVVSTHQFGIETDPPGRQRLGPNTEDAGVFINESLAGVEFDRFWSGKGKRSVAVGRAAQGKGPVLEGAVSTIGIVWKKDFRDRFEVLVVDRTVAVAKSQTRSELRRKLILQLGKIGFFILL